MANYMAGVAKLLGVELGESFHIEGDDYYFFRFTEEGFESSADGIEWAMATSLNLRLILSGAATIVKKWKPRKNEEYYFPRPDTKALWHYDTWDENEIDCHRFSHGLVFRTPREATEAAKKMLRVL